MQTPVQDVIAIYREWLKELRPLPHDIRDATATATGQTHAGHAVTIGARANTRDIRFDPLPSRA
ncbi:hypothetical protein GCM10029978_108930 [Actinoallomurus acanthiterrae]